MENKNKSIIVGLSFVGAIVLFVWGFQFLKGKSLNKDYPVYYAVYGNVNELSPANKVMVNGMQVGHVEDLYFHPKKDGSIVVKFSVNSDICLPSNTVACITNDFLGANSINLVLGDSKEYVSPGDTLCSANDNGLFDMISNQLIPLKDKVEMLVMSLDTLSVKINYVFDAKMQSDIKNSVNDLSVSLNNLKDISGDLQQIVDSEKDKFTGIVNNVDNITGNLSAISDSLALIKYNQLISSLQSTVDNMNVITANLKNGEGSAGLLLKDDSLYVNMNKTIENISVLIKKIEEDPKKYIRISVF